MTYWWRYQICNTLFIIFTSLNLYYFIICSLKITVCLLTVKSSMWVRFKSYLRRWCYRHAPPKVTWSEVTSPALIGSHGSDRLRMRNGTFCSTVVQNVSLRMTDRATEGHVTPKGFPLVGVCATWFPALFSGNDVTPKGWKGARMRSRKLGLPVLIPRTFFPVLFFTIFLYPTKTKCGGI